MLKVKAHPTIFFGLLLCCLMPVCSAFAFSDTRSDSIDITKIKLDLNITDFANQMIRGNATVFFTPIHHSPHIRLDLVGMSVDSVKLNGNNIPFQYDSKVLKVQPSSAFGQGMNQELLVFYKGSPQRDSTWGGFYFQNGIAYNIGVGFSSRPHNLGRLWFPCFDNFVERFTVQTKVTTLSNHKAFCGGTLQSRTDLPDGTVAWNWEMNEPIPSYLVSVAVGPYTSISGTFSGVNGNVPFMHGVLPADSIRLVNSFVNLESCFDLYENLFGAYPFSRVGYVVVPFSGGAMEHASNIAYARMLVNGQTTYECDYMAHELSHMWFGDKVTCSHSKDMWLNEGWATFAGSLFREHINGRAAYEDEIRKRRNDVIRFAHIEEDDYLTLSQIPEDYTYGTHVYNKGADVVNTLRGYLGDSVFFLCVRNYLQEFAFRDASSDSLKHSFEQSSGRSLDAFFNTFVHHSGFLNVEVDSFHVAGSNVPYQVSVFLHQSLKGPAVNCSDFPVEITLIDAQGHTYTAPAVSSEVPQMISLSSPVFPKAIFVNEHEKSGLAQTGITKTIATPGNIALAPIQFNLTLQQLSDTAVIRVTQHYVQPDGFDPLSGYRCSTERFFSIEGVFPDTFDASGSFIYDGRTFSPSGTQYLDNLLLTETEDSLFLFYRENPSHHWAIYPYYTKIAGNVNDKYGTMRIDSLLPGHYVLAMKDETAGMQKNKGFSRGMQVYPNPGNDAVSIVFSDTQSLGFIRIINMQGAQVSYSENVKSGEYLDIKSLTPGIYFVHADHYPPVKLCVAP